MNNQPATTSPEPRRKPFGLLRLLPAGLIALLLLPGVLAPSLQAQSTATVHLEPAQLTLKQGETAALEIRLENARDVYGIDVRLAFDPALLEVIDADPNQTGVQMTPGSFPKPELIAINMADNAAGQARFMMTQLNPTPPATGSGVVLAITVRARAGGVAELTIPLVEMSDRDGTLLTVDVGSSTIEVQGDPPVATGIPIQPPSGGTAGEAPAPATAAPGAGDAEATAPISPGSTPDRTTNAPPPGPTPIVPATTVTGAGQADAPPAGQTDQTAALPPGDTDQTGQATVPPDETAGGEAGDEMAAAISAAISSLQPGEVVATPQAEEAPTQAPAPRVIGAAANTAPGASQAGTATPDPADGRLASGAIIAAVAILSLTGLALTRRRGRHRTDS